MTTLKYTSIKDHKILIKTGDQNNSSWRKLLNNDTQVKYKKVMFNVDTETKTIVSIENFTHSSVLMVKKRVQGTKWTTEQKNLMAAGGTINIEGVNYIAENGKKICKCCNELMEVDFFGNSKSTKDSLFPKCKVCDKKRNHSKKIAA